MELNKKIIIGSVVLVIGLFLGKAFFSTRSEQPVESTDNTEQVEMAEPAVSKDEPAADASAQAPADASAQAEVDPAVVQAQFSEALKSLGTCLDVKNVVDSDQKEPTLDNLVASVRNELGDPVIRSEDWSNTLLTLPNGEQRRLRLEMEYDADDHVVKRLKYYKLENDNLVPLPLENESSADPQDSFIASLESEGKVTTREKGSRMYFQNGEEVVFVEKNDRIADVEINRNGRTFKCVGLDSGRSTCSCL